MNQTPGPKLCACSPAWRSLVPRDTDTDLARGADLAAGSLLPPARHGTAPAPGRRSGCLRSAAHSSHRTVTPTVTPTERGQRAGLREGTALAWEKRGKTDQECI